MLVFLLLLVKVEWVVLSNGNKFLQPFADTACQTVVLTNIYSCFCSPTEQREGNDLSS